MLNLAQDLFKEIAVVFAPQDYSFSEAVLEVQNPHFSIGGERDGIPNWPTEGPPARRPIRQGHSGSDGGAQARLARRVTVQREQGKGRGTGREGRRRSRRGALGTGGTFAKDEQFVHESV